MSSVVVILLMVITSVNSIVSKKNLVIYDKVGEKSIYDSLNVRYVGGLSLIHISEPTRRS